MPHRAMLDILGWLATAIFSASYLFRQPAALRRVQAAAACLWIAYGLAIESWPVVAANILVAIAALASVSRTGQKTVGQTPRPAR
jgi:hypothetical protein